MVDPWDEDAPGCRYPDSYRGLSGTYAGTSVSPITTGGTFTDLNMTGVTPTPGTSLLFITPDPQNIVVNGVCGQQASGFLAGVPDQFAWPNGILFTNAALSKNAFGPGSGVIDTDVAVGNINGMRQLYSAARCVAGGVKITSTMNFSTVSGTIHMAPYFYDLSFMTTTLGGQTPGGDFNSVANEMANGWQAVLPTNLEAMANLPGYVQFPVSALEQDEMAAIFKRSGDEALLFKSLRTAWGMSDQDSGATATRTGSASVPDNVGHYGILLFVDGVTSSTGGALANNTPILEMEYRAHYECQPTTAITIAGGNLFSTGGTSLCSRAPNFQPLLMAAIDNIAAEIPSIRCVDVSGVEEAGFMTEVASLWKNATAIASSVYQAVPAVAGLLSALAI